MLVRLSELVVRRRALILVLTLIGLLLAGALGGGVASRLSSGGFEDANAESTNAEHALEQFGGESNMLLLVRAKHGTVDSADVVKAGTELTTRLAGDTRVSFAASYWS